MSEDKNPDFEGFAKEIMVWREWGIDACDLEEKALKFGILKAVKVTEFCGEHCVCAGVTDLPAYCYRLTY